MNRALIIILLLLLSMVSGSMISPSDGKLLNYTHVLFEWKQQPNAYEYQLEISNTQSFSDTITSINTNQLIYIDTDNLTWDTNYYWRVRAIYDDNSTSDWLDQYSFTILSPVTSANITLHLNNQYQDGVTLLGSYTPIELEESQYKFTAAFDKYGNEVWNTQDNNIIMYNTNMMGEFYGCYFDQGQQNEYPPIEFNLDGESVWVGPTDESSDHDLIQLPDGNYLSIVKSYRYMAVPYGPWYNQCLQTNGAFVCDNYFPWRGDKLVIWDKDEKNVLWSWDTFDYYSTDDFDGANYSSGINGGTWPVGIINFEYDWTHINSLTYIEEHDAIYMSSRHLSRLTKINFNIDDYNDPTNGQIIWNMGQNMPSGEVDCGDDLKFSWQHTISVLENDNIVILDNGNLSHQLNEDLSSPITRALEINPNEIEGGGCDAEIVWEHSLSEDLFGLASGGVQKLDNGNYLITTAGVLGVGGVSHEVSLSGELVWEANYNLDPAALQRGFRVSSLYPVSIYPIVSNFEFVNETPHILANIGDSKIEIELFNNGTEDETFIYSFSSVEGDWFPSMSGSVQISKGDSATIILIGSVETTNANSNDVLLTLSSVNNKNIIKDYSYKVYPDDSICITDGDITFDSNLDIFDIITIISYIMGNEVFQEDRECVVDFNNDIQVNILDVLSILDLILY